ncbi:MAG: DUF2163 domain-containing protein [Sphingomicrobium sp.]
MTDIVEGELTSLALCWRLERADGAGLGLTSHDRDVIEGGAAYTSEPGILPAAVSRNLGLEPQSSEVGGALSSEALDSEDLALGRWDGARVKLFAIDWNKPESEGVDLVAGELGEVSINGDGFSAELRGTASKLEGALCPSTSPQCRAQFGDKQCRVDLAGRSKRATVVTHENGAITLNGSVGDDFLLGRLHYLSGANCGRSTVVVAVNGTTVQVRDIPRGAIAPGCVVELREGCDKRFQTCVDRFANAANFRGEPHLPGADLLTRYPGA